MALANARIGEHADELMALMLTHLESKTADAVEVHGTDEACTEIKQASEKVPVPARQN